MMRISLKTRIVCLQLCLTLASTLQAADKFVSFIREEGTLELVTSQQRSFSILCADEEHKGVLTAVHNLQEDFYKVADIRPALVADAKQKGSTDYDPHLISQWTVHGIIRIESRTPHSRP